MSRLGGWFKGSSPKLSNGGTANLAESEYLSDALFCANLIMNDEMEEAERKLNECESSFHLLGRGVTRFMKSILGFEPEIMKDAAAKLAEAEAIAWADMKKARKDSNGARTSIYPPGSEYALCYAQAQLMSAVVGVLNINLVEATKSFYKLRKAWQSLDGILASERQGLNSLSKTSLSSHVSRQPIPGCFDDDDDTVQDNSNSSSENEDSPKTVDEVTSQNARIADDDDSDLEFEDAEEDPSGAEPTSSSYLGHVASTRSTNKKLDDPPFTNSFNGKPPEILTKPIGDKAPEPSIFTDPIDVFIHSGTYCCYGLLLLIISLVPPAFSKILSIIGFKGDRERGIGMLWQSTKFENINGGVSALVLLFYYNLATSCDILPSADADGEDLLGYPVLKCRALLDDMSTRYPTSRLWKLQAGLMHEQARDLERAIETLSHDDDSQIKQVTFITLFEKSLALMFLHRYQECSDSFMKCKDMNDWSHCLLYLIAGGCHVCLYRELKEKDPESAAKHKQIANDFFKKSPSAVGKKRFLARPNPFDIFSARKVQKWGQRSKEWGCDLVDAVGVSPIEEIIYLWNGAKKMNDLALEKSLQTLEWSQTSYPDRHKADLDEVALQALLTASVSRNLGKFDEARQILTTKVLNHNKSEFTGGLKDDWSLPCAHYEMAVLAWYEKDLKGADHNAKVLDCESWLEKVAKWEAYTMDARIGVRVGTAKDTVSRYKAKYQL